MTGNWQCGALNTTTAELHFPIPPGVTLRQNPYAYCPRTTQPHGPKGRKNEQ